MHSITPAIPFADLHHCVLAACYDLAGGSVDHDDFTALLARYQLHQAESDRVDQIADTCDRRARDRRDLPLDLIAAYGSLSALARWRAAQLRGERQD